MLPEAGRSALGGRIGMKPQSFLLKPTFLRCFVSVTEHWLTEWESQGWCLCRAGTIRRGWLLQRDTRSSLPVNRKCIHCAVTPTACGDFPLSIWSNWPSLILRTDAHQLDSPTWRGSISGSKSVPKSHLWSSLCHIRSWFSGSGQSGVSTILPSRFSDLCLVFVMVDCLESPGKTLIEGLSTLGWPGGVSEEYCFAYANECGESPPTVGSTTA